MSADKGRNDDFIGIEQKSDAQSRKLEALGRFAGGIAHDFNNILSVVEGYTHIALKQLKEGNLTKEQLEKILLSTQKGANLTRQLLSFSRMKVDVEDKINLGTVIKDQHVILRPLLGDSIKLFITVPDEPVWIRASEDQLMQILLNLTLNARDAMPNGGELAIIFIPCHKHHVPKALRQKYPERSFLRLSVVDSGVGMSSETLSRIFEPFFTTKGQGKGTGLGLSVVYGIVDQLQGAIEVSSVPNEGTSFDIYLPEVSPPENTTAIQPVDVSGIANGQVNVKVIPTPNTNPLAGKTILIVEDDDNLREILGDMFKSMSMSVLLAADGNKALTAQEDYEGHIDFLLTDVVMPGMDGVKLSELFTALRPDSDVVYMSGYPFLDGSKEINLPEKADFISKPFKEDKLKQILERALQRKRERLDQQGKE